MRRFAGLFVLLLIASISSVFVSTTGVAVQAASSLTPPKGTWGFCTSATQVGCIEYFAMENPSGALREYGSMQEAQDAGIIPSASCYVSGANASAPSCDPTFAYTGSTTCGTAGTYLQFGVGYTPTFNGQLVDGSQFVGRKITLRVRTGDYDPVFAMGGQINSTTRTVNADGTFLFEVRGQIQTTYGVNVSSVSMTPYETYRTRLSAFLAQSIATSTGYGFGATVYSRSWLKSTSLDLNGLCVEVPLVDSWADANGMGFETSLVPARPTDPIASTIKLKVAGPHFLPESNGNDGKIVPARVRFFASNSFIAASGYADPSQFNEKSLSVTAYQGEAKTPTLTRTTSGIVIDFGIAHYSTPDPIVTVYKFGYSASGQVQTPTVTSTSLPLSVATTPVASQWTSVKAGKSITRNAILSRAKLTVPKGGSVALKVSATSSKVCRLIGSGVKALKAGNCKVSVTVRTKAGKKSAKTVSIAVVR